MGSVVSPTLGRRSLLGPFPRGGMAPIQRLVAGPRPPAGPVPWALLPIEGSSSAMHRLRSRRGEPLTGALFLDRVWRRFDSRRWVYRKDGSAEYISVSIGDLAKVPRTVICECNGA